MGKRRRCPIKCICDCHEPLLSCPHPGAPCPGKTWDDYWDEIALANSKRRCRYCRHYVPAGDINRQGCCSDDCTRKLADRARQKQRRDQRALSSAVQLEEQTRPPKQKPKKRKKGSLPPDIRRRVMSRDGARCRMTGTSSSVLCEGILEVHHIKYRSEFGRGQDDPLCDQPSNLIVLCSRHHNSGKGSVHADKARWQRVCRAYIWLHYVHGVQLSLIEIDRHLQEGDDAFAGWVIARWVDSRYAEATG